MRGSIKSVGGVLVMGLLVTGCGWFESTSKPEKLRPGAERNMQPSDSLPAPSGGRSFDPPIMPMQAAQPAIGSVVPASGGQKAQLEKIEKDAAARDAEDRAQRERLAADRARSEGDKSKGEPGKVAGNTGSGAPGDRGEPPILPTTPSAPPSAPITSTPVPPPADAPAKPAGT